MLESYKLTLRSAAGLQEQGHQLFQRYTGKISTRSLCRTHVSALLFEVSRLLNSIIGLDASAFVGFAIHIIMQETDKILLLVGENFSIFRSNVVRVALSLRRSRLPESLVFHWRCVFLLPGQYEL